METFYILCKVHKRDKYNRYEYALVMGNDDIGYEVTDASVIDNATKYATYIDAFDVIDWLQAHKTYGWCIARVDMRDEENGVMTIPAI